MELGHLEQGHRLSTAVAWPHRPEDWALLLELGRGLVALDGKEVVGTIMWWPFSNSRATLGMIIVAPAWQGSGYGRRLMEAALAKIGPRQIVLNATREGLPLYAKMGFEGVGVIGQHQGMPNGSEEDRTLEGASIRPLRQDDVEGVAVLDSQATGWPRETMLRRLAAVGEGKVLEREGRLLGYAVCRQFGCGHVIGPVVASGDQAARALISSWIQKHSGGFVRIDTPLTGGLFDWLTSRGLLKVDDVVTMSRGATSTGEQPSPNVFALASQALG